MCQGLMQQRLPPNIHLVIVKTNSLSIYFDLSLCKIMKELIVKLDADNCFNNDDATYG